MNIEVCFSPELVPYYHPEGKIVVVADILRATSCMTAGLGTVLDTIVPVATLEEVVPFQEQGFVTAGERNGVKIEHFDLGNSPFDFMQPSLSGRSVVMTTTNGTKAIHLSRSAEQIVAASFLNLEAVATYLAEQKLPVLVVCAGWKSKFSLEDTLFAGTLANRLLQDGFSTDCDGTLAATELYRAHFPDLLALVRRSSHAKRLGKMLIHDDIAYCLQTSIFGVVPIMEGNRLVKRRQ